MNNTQARIIAICDKLDYQKRFSEYIAAKLGLDYRTITSYLRRMEYLDWIKTERYKQRKVIKTIDPAKLEEAKELLRDA